jgi:TRAP-type mannitol/chloroaromatic compound transport system permease small subunit
MMDALRAYVRIVDRMNYMVGRVVMYGIFVMVGILAWSVISKVALIPSLWTIEMAQYAMVAYYLLGGAYSVQLGADIRMDLFYGSWSDRRKAWFDVFTVMFLIFYLGVLLYGGVDSMMYSIEYGQRSPSAWRPYIWPVKAIMISGIFLMLLQAISELFKDVLKLRGEAV